MRILWIIHAYPPILNAGAEMYAHNLNKHLIAQGHEVKVFLPKGYSNFENKTANYEGIDLYVLGDLNLSNLVYWSDIVMTHLDFTSSTMAYVKDTKPIVFVSHNTFFDAYKYIDGNENISVIYNSYAMKQISLDFLANKSFVMRPPILLPPNETKRNPINNEYITLINLNRNKGGEFLRELAKRLPNKKFMGVIGGYDAQVIDQPPNVKIMAHTNNIKSIYDETRIILMPSFYESWGMVASEAMLNGIPVIANKTFGLEENLSYAGTYCNLTDIEQWKRAILSYDNEEIYKVQSEKCIKRSVEQKEMNTTEMKNCINFLENIYSENIYKKTLKIIQKPNSTPDIDQCKTDQ
jgi:glycosyltransferase involved in cell wall biosynthesis